MDIMVEYGKYKEWCAAQKFPMLPNYQGFQVWSVFTNNTDKPVLSRGAGYGIIDTLSGHVPITNKENFNE